MLCTQSGIPFCYQLRALCLEKAGGGCFQEGFVLSDRVLVFSPHALHLTRELAGLYPG